MFLVTFPVTCDWPNQKVMFSENAASGKGANLKSQWAIQNNGKKFSLHTRDFVC